MGLIAIFAETLSGIITNSLLVPLDVMQAAAASVWRGWCAHGEK